MLLRQGQAVKENSRLYNERKGISLNIALVVKIAGVGLLVSIACQILQKTGRDEQATFVSVAGVIIVMLLLVSEIGKLFSTIRSVFGL